MELPLTDTQTTHTTASALTTLASEHAQATQTTHTTASALTTLASEHTQDTIILASEHAQKKDIVDTEVDCQESKKLQTLIGIDQGSLSHLMEDDVNNVERNVLDDCLMMDIDEN